VYPPQEPPILRTAPSPPHGLMSSADPLVLQRCLLFFTKPLVLPPVFHTALTPLHSCQPSTHPSVPPNSLLSSRQPPVLHTSTSIPRSLHSSTQSQVLNLASSPLCSLNSASCPPVLISLRSFTLSSVRQTASSPHQSPTVLISCNRKALSERFLFLFVFFVYFWRAKVFWKILCLCRAFCIFERFLDSNPESSRSKQAR